MVNPVFYQEDNFPPKDLEWESLTPLLGPVAKTLGKLDAMSGLKHVSSRLIPILRRIEAGASTRIEGTQVSADEVMEYEASKSGMSPSRTDDIIELIRCELAAHQIKQSLETKPLCNRIICEAHKVLMQHSRGHNKAPGEFRKVPVHIGSPDSTIKTAHYVPIVANKLPDSMSRWEKFIHEDFPDRLVQSALIHAEFEALHPFMDGNGRIGRLMIPFVLYQHKVIDNPEFFYVSNYLEKHRQEYYEGLRGISSSGNWIGWCKFFITAIEKQAEITISTVERILELHEEMKGRIPKLTHSQFSSAALDFIFECPIFKSAQMIESARIAPHNAHRIIKLLVKNGVLEQKRPRSGSSPALYQFNELMEILKS